MIIAEGTMETTIWSKLEAEKKRQNLIRTKLLSSNENSDLSAAQSGSTLPSPAISIQDGASSPRESRRSRGIEGETSTTKKQTVMNGVLPPSSAPSSPTRSRRSRSIQNGVPVPPSSSAPSSPTRSRRSRSIEEESPTTRKQTMNRVSATNSSHPDRVEQSSRTQMKALEVSLSGSNLPSSTPLENSEIRSSHRSSRSKQSPLTLAQTTPVLHPGKDRGYPDSGASQDSSIRSVSLRSSSRRSTPQPTSEIQTISSFPMAPDLARSVSGSPESSITRQISPESSINSQPLLGNSNIQPTSKTSATSSETRPTSLASTLSEDKSPGTRRSSSSPSGRRKQRIAAQTLLETDVETPQPRRKLKNQDPPSSNPQRLPQDSTKNQEHPPSSKSQEALLEEGRVRQQANEEELSKLSPKESPPKVSLLHHLSKGESFDSSERSRGVGSATSGSQTWGCQRIINEELIHETEGWVYLVAVFLLAFTMGGISCIVLFVFGAYGEQKTQEESIQSKLEYLSEDPSVFEDPSSPQSMALKWLVDNSDEAQLGSGVRRESRYALAVLYFATEGGTLWKDDLQFLSSAHECAWTSIDEADQGVYCDDDWNVVNLTIVSNKLRGTLPIEISALSSLISMDLSDNRLSGTIPSLRFANLEVLSLGLNGFEGSLPNALADLSNLTLLDLSSNTLSSTLPASIGQLTKLETLKIGFNQINGTFTYEIASLDGLKELNLTSNSIGGTVEFIKKFPLLEKLDLSLNEFLGTIPSDLGGLANLESFVFSNNKLQGSLPSTLGNLNGLKHLAGSNNILSGMFPWSSFSENQLVKILMADNVFSGPLPPDIFRFETLEVVDFGGNQLSGSIPIAIGGMASLKELQLSLNGLTGKLPQGLGLLESVLILDVAGNTLSSTIPPTLGSLKNSLKRLNLHSNDLFGEVPPELGELYGIERISLHNNRLNGTVGFLCSIESMPIISADCGGDPPKIICPCCAVCLQ